MNIIIKYVMYNIHIIIIIIDSTLSSIIVVYGHRVRFDSDAHSSPI